MSRKSNNRQDSFIKTTRSTKAALITARESKIPITVVPDRRIGGDNCTISLYIAAAVTNARDELARPGTRAGADTHTRAHRDRPL